jgi:hypothetical protein
MTLEEFISGPYRNHYIEFGSLHSYTRKGHRYYDGHRLNAITRANTTNRRRASNILTKPGVKSTGLYRALDDLTVELGIKYGFEMIRVENVLNPFLPDVLLRYGYTRLTPEDHGLDWGGHAPSFVKIIG